MIGTGIHSIRDISVAAKDVILGCASVFLEGYTSILKESPEEMEAFLGVPVEMLSREDVEQRAEMVLEPSKKDDVAFLVIGDVFGATTHTDLFLRAKQSGVDVRVYHNASILSAVGITGLELYKFGKTTSLVFFEDDWRPQTAYDVIRQNRSQGLHTLVLLDIKTAEASKKDMLTGKDIVLPSRFMTIREALEQLLSIEKERGDHVFTDEMLCVGCARLGSESPTIKRGTARELLDVDFGGPLHSLIIPGDLHFVEEEALGLWR
jgi:diphthine synthase